MQIKRGIRMKKVIKIFMLIFIIGLLVFVFAYLFTGNYKAFEEAQQYLKSTDDVKVTKIDEGYFFDGKGDAFAIIFYPGAKVDYEAYSKLMYDLADVGYDTFLLKMPFNLAFFGKNKALKIMEKYEYDNVYVAGHSLGGVVANSFAADHNDDLMGVINFASYPAEQIPDDLYYIYIFGTEDMVMYREKYEESKKYAPQDFKEVIISGGNHSGFGLYGPQENDGEAKISKDEQIEQAVFEIDYYIKLSDEEEGDFSWW